MRWSLFGCLTMLVAMPAADSAIGRSDAAEAPACVQETFEGDAFLVCRYVPGRDEIRLARRGPDGRPGSLAELEEALGTDRRRVRFAMNAGMYDPKRRPLGLYIARGKEERPLDRDAGTGNFYMLPNGVLWVDADGSPHVDESEAFAASGAKPVWATQSGPLLLRAGAMHPAISENGPSRHVRNGVGILDGQALFVISESEVSFGRFARFFRDGLGCADALYLDGTVSSLWVPALGRQDKRSDLGTFLIVLRAKGKAGSREQRD
jgi:uncharacterized protein YigE (DUF2233 family)